MSNTNEQQAHLTLALSSLMEYANTALRITRPIPKEQREFLSGVRQDLIAKALWRNVDIIENYARENPAGLPASWLDIARSWKHVLYSSFVLLRSDYRGRLELLHETGIYLAEDPTGALSHFATSSPCSMRLALLPCAHTIIAVAPMQFTGKICDFTIDELVAESDGIDTRRVSRASEFLRRSRRYHRMVERRKNLYKGLSLTTKEAVPGFHQSPLAELSPNKRARAIERWKKNQELQDGAEATTQSQLSACRAAQSALACRCGVIPLDDAYLCYCNAVADPISLSRFRELAAQAHTQSSFGRAYKLWEHEGCSYLLDARLSWRGALFEAMHALARKSPSHELSREEMLKLAQDIYEQKKAQRCELAENSRALPAVPLEPSCLNEEPFSWMGAGECIEAIRCFLDAHVPDGQNDYLFADEAINKLLAALYCQVDYDLFLDNVVHLGLEHCEGTSFSDTLGQLLTTLYNAVPLWSLNGWSSTQVEEYLCGKKPLIAGDSRLEEYEKGGCPAATLLA